MAEGVIIGDAVITMPDGTTASFPVIKGTEGPVVIDIRTLYQKLSVFTIDPGFTSTSSCMSSITYIDGDQGELWYRGYRIQDLADKCSFLEVCYLLMYGELPTKPQLDHYETAIKAEMCIHSRLIDFYSSFQQGAHPMAIMVGVVGALSAFLDEKKDYDDIIEREKAAIKIVAKFPMIAAVAYRTAYGLPIVFPKKKYSYVENFLYMMFSDPMSDDFQVDPVVVDAMEKIFILHADHEQNASTSTVRIAGSSLANPFACIAAGIASLWGPMHGGANEAVLCMLDEIKNRDRIDEYINRAKNPTDTFRIMGFGHRVYKNHDPRSKIMGKIAHKVLDVLGSHEKELFQLAIELEQKALSDEYFIKRKLYPNVDYYSGVVLEAIGIPRDMFTVIFALSRVIGWITQWSEMMGETVKKIGRPRQLYVGSKVRDVVPIEERESRLLSPALKPYQRNVWSPTKRQSDS
jgi:citrate synthase